MRRTASLLALAVALGLSCPAMARGQSHAGPPDAAPPASPASPPSPRMGPIAAGPSIGFRVFVNLDEDRLAASKSFQAVAGRSRLRKIGFGADVTNLWRGLFARFAVSNKKLTATRVDVTPDGQVFDHHIPGTIALRPLELAAGWRAGLAGQHLLPYVGAGLVFLKYDETWTGGTPDDDVAQTFKGFSLFGGLDLGVAPHVTFGIEGQYRTVPNAIGAGGVSQVFSETNLGGFTLRVRLGAGW